MASYPREHDAGSEDIGYEQGQGLDPLAGGGGGGDAPQTNWREVAREVADAARHPERHGAVHPWEHGEGHDVWQGVPPSNE